MNFFLVLLIVAAMFAALAFLGYLMARGIDSN